MVLNLGLHTAAISNHSSLSNLIIEFIQLMENLAHKHLAFQLISKHLVFGSNKFSILPVKNIINSFQSPMLSLQRTELLSTTKLFSMLAPRMTKSTLSLSSMSHQISREIESQELNLLSLQMVLFMILLKSTMEVKALTTIPRNSERTSPRASKRNLKTSKEESKNSPKKSLEKNITQVSLNQSNSRLNPQVTKVKLLTPSNTKSMTVSTSQPPLSFHQLKKMPKESPKQFSLTPKLLSSSVMMLTLPEPELRRLKQAS